MKPRLLAALAVILLGSAWADSTAPQPILSFATGLPGQQVHLEWSAVPGVRYRIEKSTDLGSGAAGGWAVVATVDAANNSEEWTDSLPTESRAFYRILQPQPEVFFLEDPVLSPTGGTIIVHGQCLSGNTLLTLEIAGEGLVSGALVQVGPGKWTATFGGVFVPGAAVISAAVTNSLGTTVADVDADISITETGFARDAPAGALPPAAPWPQQASVPVPGVGVVIKKHPGSGGSSKRAGPGEDCDDDDDDDFIPVNAAVPVPGVGVVIKKGDRGSHKRGDGSEQEEVGDDASDIRLSPGRGGVPGEVCLEYDALTLATPAGPPVAWLMNYRSVAPLSSGHGPGWDFAYNIFLEAASTTAPQVVVHDGGGRADVFRRAADGSYRADGLARVGSFSGNVFTLIFANGGSWTFHALDGSVTSGKIESIVDPNGNTLTCSHDGVGQLIEVASDFGQTLAVSWSGGRITSIADHTLRSVSFSYDGSGALQSIGTPVASGLPPEAGATSFTYSALGGDVRLDGNLLSITDGAGRLLESFSYATTDDPGDIEFDTVSTHIRNKLNHGLEISHVRREGGFRVVYENDELGRVTEVHYDRQNRPVLLREHTGFATTETKISESDLPLAGKIRATDPDFYETTWAYNGDSNVTTLTGADGSQMLMTYERDLNPACAVRERGNVRVQTLVSSGGEKRTITMEHEPSFGTPECARPGNPIGGLNVKGGRNPGGANASARPGNPIGGLNVKGGKNPGGGLSRTRRRVEVLKSNKQGDPNANRGITINTSHVEYATAQRLVGGGAFGKVLRVAFSGDPDAYNGMDDTEREVQIIDLLSEGGDNGDNDCDDEPEDDDDYLRRRGLTRSKSFVEWCARPSSFLKSLSTSHGQLFTWTHDAGGNCTSFSPPVAGGGAVYVHDSLGRLTSVTHNNGAGPGFHDELTYGLDDYLASYTEDATPGGRNLTTSYEYDSLGRVTRVVDPMSEDWLLTWSPLDVCTQCRSPEVAGQRIDTDYAYDASGRLARCDVQLRDAFGNVDPGNASYSTFWSYDVRGRLAQVAMEERPTNTTGLLEPDPLTIENFAVTDYTYDFAGQVVRLSTPAICRGQSSDAVIDLTYDERGLLHHAIAGGSGAPDSVTVEYDYDFLGACVREACLAPDGDETLYTYDGFHRPASVTDAMGNQCVFTYDEAGRVTTSIYGETEDVAGSAGNVLLARVSENLGNNVNWDFGGASMAHRREIGAYAGDEDRGLNLRSDRPRKARQAWQITKEKAISDRACPPDRPVRCGGGTCAAFFAVYSEDDVVEVERFSPGAPQPHPVETTVYDRSPASLLSSITVNGDLLVLCGYDTNGSLSSLSNAARTVDFNRDGREDIVFCAVTNVHRVTLPPPNMTVVHTVTRDSLGRVTAVTDGAGNACACEYDSLGRVTSATAPGRPPVTFAYDGTDVTGDYSVAAACDIDNGGVPQPLHRSLFRSGISLRADTGTGYSSTYTYDALDRVVRCDRPDGTFTACVYDQRGFLAACTLADSSITTYSYDPLGRATLVNQSNLPGTITPVGDTSYAYDGLGRMVRAAQDASVVTMTWDSLGNPTSETSDGRTLTRTFNHRGRTSITYPGAAAISETRNEFGQLTNAGGILFRYLGLRPYQVVQPNGVTTTYSYRGEGEAGAPGDSSYGTCVRALTTVGTSVLTDTLLEHGPDQLVTKASTYFTSEATGPGRARTYTYDGLGRVIACLTERRETLGGPVATESDVHYTFDVEGRRLSVTGGSHPGSYTQSATIPPGDHQMGQYTTWPGGSLEWDARGALSVFSDSSDILDLDSDGDGRLVALNDAGTGTPSVTYTYDALGRLASRTEHDSGGLPPVTTVMVHDGDVAVQELDDPGGTGTFSAALTFVCGDGGFKHCISTRNGTYYYPHGTSGHGASSGLLRSCGDYRGLTDVSGVVLERYDHDEAGEVLLLDELGAAKAGEIGPVRWMAPEALRERAYGLVVGNGWTYSPPLGTVIGSEKPKPKDRKWIDGKPPRKTGHVTLMK